MKTVILAAMIIGACCTCKRVENKVIKQIEAVTHKPISPEVKAIVIIPSSGCGGCINSAETYLMNYNQQPKKDQIFFIVVGHASIKSARLRLGEVVKDDNVFLDLHHLISEEIFSGAYPKVLFVDNRTVIKEMVASPQDSESTYKALDAL